MSSIASPFLFDMAIANKELQKQVVAYLASRNFHSFRRLTVRAHQGVVSLSGNLDTYYERQVAVESARRVAGVTRIIDRIIVDPESARAPDVPRFALPLTDLEQLTAVASGLTEEKRGS